MPSTTPPAPQSSHFCCLRGWDQHKGTRFLPPLVSCGTPATPQDPLALRGRGWFWGLFPCFHCPLGFSRIAVSYCRRNGAGGWSSRGVFPGPEAGSRAVAGPSVAPALRHRSPWLWFPLLSILALPCREQPLLGMARWLLAMLSPTQNAERGAGGGMVLSSGPTSRGECRKPPRGLAQLSPEVTHSCENRGRNFKSC